MTRRSIYATVGIIALVCVFSAILFSHATRSQAAATGALSGWAWSDTIGWISMSGPGYGIVVGGDGTLSGYAWSDTIGWISANSADLAGCPSGACVAKLAGNNLTGWLKALAGDPTQGWDGWISLSGSAPGGTSSGSQTFTSSGTFTVPANAGTITVTVKGAGGGGSGGTGGGASINGGPSEGSPGLPGRSGEPTSFGSLTATGGAGGAGSNGSNGSPSGAGGAGGAGGRGGTNNYCSDSPSSASSGSSGGTGGFATHTYVAGDLASTVNVTVGTGGAGGTGGTGVYLGADTGSCGGTNGTEGSSGQNGSVAISWTGGGGTYGPTLTSSNQSGTTFSGYAWGSDVVGWVDFSLVTLGNAACSNGLEYSQYGPSCMCPAGQTQQGSICTSPCTDHYECSGQIIVHVNAQCDRTYLQTCESPNMCSTGFSTCVAEPERVITALKAVPSLIRAGDSSKLFWNIENGQNCKVVGGGHTWTGAVSPPGGQSTGSLFTQTIYTLTCGPGISPETATVNIVPIYQEQ